MVGVGGDDSGLALNIYNVDATTLTITQISSTTLPIPDASVLFLVPCLAAGRFGTTLHDQLVLLYGSLDSSASVNDRLVTIDFDATLKPTVKSTLDLGTTLGDALSGARVLRSGRLNWFGQFDQAVVLASSGNFGENPDTATIRVFDV